VVLIITLHPGETPRWKIYLETGVFRVFPIQLFFIKLNINFINRIKSKPLGSLARDCLEVPINSLKIDDKKWGYRKINCTLNSFSAEHIWGKLEKYEVFNIVRKLEESFSVLNIKSMNSHSFCWMNEWMNLFQYSLRAIAHRIQKGWHTKLAFGQV